MTKFKNRIIGSGIEPLDQIQFNPRNWRIHPLNQQNALKGVLDEVGWVQEVIINKRTGNLVDGHLRCQLAAREGEKEIPVKYVDLSEEEEALILSTIDPIAAMAATDKQKLDELFRDINSDNENVQKLIGEIADKEHLEYGKRNEDAEPQIDRAAELNEKWQVKTGDLWQIGEHRLLCGDSTKREDVERVMGGEKAGLTITDPPYNYDFDYGVAKDNLTIDEYESFIRKWWSIARENCLRMIVTPGLKNLDFYYRNFKITWTCAWVKKNAMTASKIGNLSVWEPIVYDADSWDWEPVIVFGKTRKKVKRDVYEYPIRVQSDTADHPCPKLIEFWIHLVKDFSSEDELVLDVFCGSGTTMVACENLRRKCRAIEISPNYCAVILERMATAFPELEIKKVD